MICAQCRIDDLREKKKLFETMLPELIKAGITELPRISFYEGKEGLSRIINDVLWYGGKTIYTLWPYQEMLGVVGEEVLLRFNNRRLQEKISIHSLWPHDHKDATKNIWIGKDILTERRRTPKSFSFNMGYTIYGDKVSFIASHNEGFGLIVQSKDFSNLMRAQFEVLWEISKK